MQRLNLHDGALLPKAPRQPPKSPEKAVLDVTPRLASQIPSMQPGKAWPGRIIAMRADEEPSKRRPNSDDEEEIRKRKRCDSPSDTGSPARVTRSSTKVVVVSPKK